MDRWYGPTTGSDAVGVSLLVFRAVKRPSYKRAVTIVYVLGVFVQILDATVVNVALPAIGKDFDVPANEVEWVVLGYLVTLTIGIPAAAWVADRFGSKRAFIFSLVGFTVASMLCGLATSLNLLIAARVLQGLPAGLITPVGAAILYRAFPQNERARAASAVVGVAVVAPSIGPVLGGIIVDNLSWPFIFFVNLPFGLVAVALAVAWLEPEESDDPGRFDIGGFVLAAVGLGSTLFALSVAPEWGWVSARTLGFLFIGLAALAWLVGYELKRRRPMVDFRLLADRHFRTVNLVGLSIYSAFISLIYVLPIYLQQFRGFSATDAGTTQAPQAVGVFLVSNLAARRAYNRFGARAVLFAGASATFAVSLAFVLVGPDTSLWSLRLATLARGLSVGFLFVTIQTIAYATTSLADTGRAVSIFTTQRQLATALGTAIVATSLTSALDVGWGLNAYRAAFAVGALLFVPAIVWSLTVRESDVANTREQASAAG